MAIHVSSGGAGLADTATAGTPSNYFSWHNLFPNAYMTQVNSLIVEGVFEAFPDLTFVCVEGGFAWVPHLTWRMDKNWRALRDQAPWLDRPPSAYVRNHVRFTTQPIVEPERPEHLLQLLSMMHAEETLMFSSDFPHWDTDDPRLVLPRETPPEVREQVMAGTAAETYDLPDLN